MLTELSLCLQRIFDLVNSEVLQDKIGGVMIIERLIDTHYDENVHVFTRFANHLRTVLSVGPGTEAKVMVMAARALGRLAKASDNLTRFALCCLGGGVAPTQLAALKTCSAATLWSLRSRAPWTASRASATSCAATEQCWC